MFKHTDKLSYTLTMLTQQKYIQSQKIMTVHIFITLSIVSCIGINITLIQFL